MSDTPSSTQGNLDGILNNPRSAGKHLLQGNPSEPVLCHAQSGDEHRADSPITVDFAVRDASTTTSHRFIATKTISLTRTMSYDSLKTIPFLNGGLFECLDAPSKEDATQILRVDGFSDRNDNPLYVPNELFFSDERTVDLNAAYGTREKRHKVRGLIHILSSYKFTIAENTPIEEEVALDPELLGKVFENLLAAYNPETEATARKQTGSFYTPREIVNYMTDESLIAYLKNELITYSESQRTFSVTTPPSQLDFTKKADPVQRELDVETVSCCPMNKKLRLRRNSASCSPITTTQTHLMKRKLKR